MLSLVLAENSGEFKLSRSLTSKDFLNNFQSAFLKLKNLTESGTLTLSSISKEIGLWSEQRSSITRGFEMLNRAFVSARSSIESEPLLLSGVRVGSSENENRQVDGQLSSTELIDPFRFASMLFQFLCLALKSPAKQNGPCRERSLMRSSSD